MVFIPLIYFVCLFAIIFIKHKSWNMDLAATSLLIVISFFAIMIDVNDVYGDYGINEYSLTLPTVILFCIQWTFIIYLINTVCRLPIQTHIQIKEKLLYFFLVLITVSSVIMIATKSSDIKEALIMDMADVRGEHYKDLAQGSNDGTNYLMLIPQLLVCVPFPTAALFFWFYMKSFMHCSKFLQIGILLASIVQAVLAIIMAGRAAMIYWTFDFYMLYSYFYQYLAAATKRIINLTAFVLGGMAAFLFISITIARFNGGSRDPFESLYGYAGQHLNNFCTMFVHASDSPFSIDRIFPFTSKILGHQFDLMEHYDTITSNIKDNIIVNVFDTFGGEIYLDLGWIGYFLFFVFVFVSTKIIQSWWIEVKFHHVFVLIIITAFFTRGLFAWPFVNHYTTIALALTMINCYMFKYKFKI